jgi:branched-chain amino acid transport system substrate-binding protein
MIDVAAETETPMISMAASSRIVEPVDAKRRWVFKTPQNDQQMALVIVGDMLSRGIKTVGYIGFADAYGEGWWNEFSKIAETRGLKVVANERYQRSDTSVTGQVLKLVAAKPEAVLIGASGTPAALPQKTLKERGYAGKIYQTHGVANNDFLRVCGKDCEGTLLPAGPVLVSAQLPADHPVKKSAIAYVDAYEKANGKGSVSTFGAHAWDAGVLLQVAIPIALKTAQPGTKEFRQRCATPRKREERRRSSRHLQHEYKRPSRSRPARSGDGDDREWRLDAAEVAKRDAASSLGEA